MQYANTTQQPCYFAKGETNFMEVFCFLCLKRTLSLTDKVSGVIALE